MTSQAVASDPPVFSTDLEMDPALGAKCAIVVPFSRNLARCECPEEIWREKPLGCKDCAPVSALSKLKVEATEQTMKRWAWFSDARKLDDELSTRLGTLGNLPWEIRVKIFRCVLDEYIEEALTYRTFESRFCRDGFYPSPLEWREMKDKFKERFKIETFVHRSQVTELYKIFSLHSRNRHHQEPDFPMPLRLATIDTKFEFDHVFLSTMTFRFSCQKALGQFLKELSAIQLSQVRSITIEIFGCYDCFQDGIDWKYKGWESVCAQLPSTLDSIKFELGGKGYHFWVWDGGEWVGGKNDLYVKYVKRAKELLEFLSCQVRHIALEAEVTMPRIHDRDTKLWNFLDAVVRETDEWSKEYVEWKKGLGSAE